jgi:GTP cyclohydrolase IA
LAIIEGLSWARCEGLAGGLANKIQGHPLFRRSRVNNLYGVPRGGVYAAMLLIPTEDFRLVETPEDADFIIDDIIDTGKTKEKYNKLFRSKPFFALVNKKLHKEYSDSWISFPWERMQNDDGPKENVRRLLEYIGEDPDREGLKETPDRVIRSYAELFSGYKQNVESVIKTFESDCSEMVLLKEIPFYSTCEHHILPFSGLASVAYVPDGRVIGVSKLARILEIYARRLQIQERLCQQVTECLMTYLKPKGAACVLKAQHLCMACRGVEKAGATMVTSSLKGVFLQDPKTRSEFMSMIGG